MFDIFCEDACQRRKFENFYDVRMTENEWKFLEDHGLKEARENVLSRPC